MVSPHGQDRTARRLTSPLDPEGAAMAFFDVPPDADITPEARRWLDELKRLRGVETLPKSWMAYARSPRILKARVTVEESVFRPSEPSGFSWEARLIAFMLVAHARRCEGCFGASRGYLTTLGFDEPALDGFCANPTVLPLPERERLFVKYVLRIATNPSELQPKDFQELQAQGLSPEDVQEITACAAHALMNTIFTTVANTALRDA
jgi:alkylhydroperoxidase family enzyme